MYVLKKVYVSCNPKRDDGFTYYYYMNPDCNNDIYPHISTYYNVSEKSNLRMVYFNSQRDAYLFLTRFCEDNKEYKIIVEWKKPEKDEKYYIFDPKVFNFVENDKYFEDKQCFIFNLDEAITYADCLIKTKIKLDNEITRSIENLESLYKKYPTLFKEIWRRNNYYTRTLKDSYGKQIYNKIWSIVNE